MQRAHRGGDADTRSARMSWRGAAGISVGKVYMNGWRRRGMHWGLAVFGIAMAGLAAWAYRRFGAALLTAVAVAIAIGCFGAMLYAWRLARRSLPPTEAPTSPAGKERP